MSTRKQAGPSTSPAMTYLGALRQRIAAIKKDTPHLTDLGEKMAEPLLAGGSLFPAPVASFWPSEFSGRAGGLMGLKWPGYEAQSPKDVAFFALPSARGWDPRKDKTLRKLLKSQARLFVIGREEELAPLGDAKRFAGFTGGVARDEGFYATGIFKPLAPLRPFETFLRGWIATGEMICACIRAGKMPAIWMSVWLEGAMVRNASFVAHNNTLEPWSVPFFHADRYIPPLPPGYAAEQFLAEIEGILTVLEKQQARLIQAGKWLAEAKKNGKRLWAILVGHSYPEILERPKDSKYPLDWGWSVSDLTKAVPPDYGAGDVVVHLGYSPVNVAHVKGIVERGIRFIYTTPYGRPAALQDHPNLIWLDLPWRPTDQSIDIPGYAVRMLPMSSSAETAAYFAMLCEMAERMAWG
ncbi:MAG: hypothetical protein ABSE73_00645 [Planctomycetota bacterium]